MNGKKLTAAVLATLTGVGAMASLPIATVQADSPQSVIQQCGPCKPECNPCNPCKPE